MFQKQLKLDIQEKKLYEKLNSNYTISPKYIFNVTHSMSDYKTTNVKNN